MSPDRQVGNGTDNAVAKLVSEFDHIPWCRSLLNDPAWVVHTPIRQQIAFHGASDTFMQKTLATPSTLKNVLMLRPKSLGLAYPRASEICLLWSLGPLLSGYVKTAHGGAVATILDEALGVFLTMNEELELEHNPSHIRIPIMTLKLALTYRKPVPSPGDVLVKVRLERIEGRKRFLMATVEDGNGQVLTEAEALFLQTNKAPGIPKPTKM